MSMIYEVVAKLLKKGAVYTATLVPLTYVPLPEMDYKGGKRNQ
jgi:hypothetical protein